MQAALMPGRAPADGAHSMATTGRQPAMPVKRLQTLAGEPRKVTAMRRRTTALTRLRIRGRAVKAIQPRDPIHRQAAASLHRLAEAFPVRGPSQLPVPQGEASPADIRASPEGGIPEVEEAGGKSRRVRSGNNAFSDGVQDQFSEAMEI